MTVSEAINYLKTIMEMKGDIGVPPSLQEKLNDFIRKSHGKKNIKI